MRISTTQIGHALAGMGLLACCMGPEPGLHGNQPSASSVYFEEEQLADAESNSAPGARQGPHATIGLAQTGERVGLVSNVSGTACGGLACASVGGGMAVAQRTHGNLDGIGSAGNMAAASFGAANQGPATGQGSPGSPGSARWSTMGRESLPSGGPSFGAPPAGSDEPASTPTIIALNEPGADQDTALPAAVPGPVFPAPVALSPAPVQPEPAALIPDGNVHPPAFSAPALVDRSGAPPSRGSDVFKKPSGQTSPPTSSSPLPMSEPETVTAAPGSGRVPVGNDGRHTAPGTTPVGQDVLDFANPLKTDPPGLVDRVMEAIRDPDIAGSDPRHDSEASPLLGNAPADLLFTTPDQAIDRVADATAPGIGPSGSPFIPSVLDDVETNPLITLAALDVPEPSTWALLALAMLGLGATRGRRRQPRPLHFRHLA